jgi:hypothetical protein
LESNARRGYAGDCGGLAFDVPRHKAQGTAVMTAHGSLSICGTPLAARQQKHRDGEADREVDGEADGKAAWRSDGDLIA